MLSSDIILNKCLMLNYPYTERADW